METLPLQLRLRPINKNNEIKNNKNKNIPLVLFISYMIPTSKINYFQKKIKKKFILYYFLFSYLNATFSLSINFLNY